MTQEDRTGEGAASGPADEGLRRVLEAVLIASEGPVAPHPVATALGAPLAAVIDVLEALALEYETERRGFRLREQAGGWRLFSAPEHAEAVQRLVLVDAPTRLSPAALETLAVVAYQQPVTRGRVSAIRGVNVDAVMRTLVSRGLLEEVGREQPSGAVLYGTTTLFLDKLGLRNLRELPKIAQFLPDSQSLEELLDSLSTGRRDL
ncbi:MAG: SMC-Scp complex subunit ScpB [Mycobacteriales bacterium]